MRKGSWIAILAGGALMAVLVVVIGWMARQQPERALEPLRFCESTTVGLGTIAKEKGFFRQQGLAVDITFFPFGRRALNAMLAGDCDMAQVFETPIVFASFSRSDFTIVATTSFATNYGIILARKDHAIDKPADLKGKRIAAMEDASGDFFLYRFLVSQGLAIDEVQVIYPPSVAQLKGGLLSGELDAISLWQPDISALAQQLGDNGIRFSAPDLVLNFATLVVRRDFLAQHPHRVSRALEAFLQAERLLEEDRPEAVRAISRMTGTPETHVSRHVDSLGTIRLELDQALLLTLEDEASWAIASGRVTGPVPNYLAFVDARPLAAVKPEVVTIFR